MLEPAVAFELGPTLHDKVRRIEFPILVSVALFLFTSGHTSLAPGKVVEMPKRIRGKDEIPNGEQEQVDNHLSEVGDLARGDGDKQTRKI